MLCLKFLFDANQVEELLSCERVGVTYWGQHLGRRGELAWLCIASPNTIFLFDAAAIGLWPLMSGKSSKRQVKPKMNGVVTSQDDGSGKLPANITPALEDHQNINDQKSHTAETSQVEIARHMCLAQVFTNPDVEIVTHDSRNLCDLFHHQLGLQIQALFDTQVLYSPLKTQTSCNSMLLGNICQTCFYMFVNVLYSCFFVLLLLPSLLKPEVCEQQNYL